jgi:hypothetical protein
MLQLDVQNAAPATQELQIKQLNHLTNQTENNLLLMETHRVMMWPLEQRGLQAPTYSCGLPYQPQATNSDQRSMFDLWAGPRPRKMRHAVACYWSWVRTVSVRLQRHVQHQYAPHREPACRRAVLSCVCPCVIAFALACVRWHALGELGVYHGCRFHLGHVAQMELDLLSVTAALTKK